VTIAGLRQLVQREHVGPDELVVACVTGAGLKTQEAVQDVLPPQLHVKPTVESFEAALLDRHGKSPVATS
jgi:threonine synthase